MPPSPGPRPRPDMMKDSILKESTAGWSNSITPLRIAKRDSIASPKGTSSLSPLPRVVARRSSNSYKHVFNNNLVSKSPFKSQIPTPARSSPRTFVVAPPAADRTPRKVSGEKRPRPDSLVQKAEIENQQRARELGFKRRQSKGFQGLVEREPVSKSPFRHIVSQNNFDLDDTNVPISIELPPTRHNDISEEDTTSLETTETESLNDKVDVYSSPPTVKPVLSPSRPLTPLAQVSQTQPFTPSPGFERRTPLPSAVQVSPTRSSLVQKPRLLGPRARSFSGSPADTPTRERRKTVTFDERCDVVEFDRASHEDSVFETDDEDVYGIPDVRHDRDSSLDSSNASADSTTPTHSPNRSRDRPSVLEVFGVGDDSISGLVDSMLQEASVFGCEPSTPESHSNSFTIAQDLDLMNGGDEGGVPHGRMHHSERVKAHQQDMNFEDQPLRSAFDGENIGEDEPSFSSISLSTPPKQHPLPPIPQQQGRTPLPSLPPDTERDEDGLPLGRTHHAERAKIAHMNGKDRAMDEDVNMLPPSPSPMKRNTSNELKSRELPDPLMPRFDLGLKFESPRGSESQASFMDDVFGSVSDERRDILAELEYEHADIDPEILSNTSIASFHEVPPQLDDDTSFDERDNRLPQQDISFGRSNLSLDASVASIVVDLQSSRERTTTSSSNEVEVGRSKVKNSPANEISTPQGSKEISFSPSRSQRLSNSQGSLSSSESGRRSPRISRDDVMRRLVKQRSMDEGSPLGARSQSPMLSPRQTQPVPAPPQRQPLEERLKKALSPSSSSTSPIPTTPLQLQERPISPSRVDPHVRAHTHDLDGRPLAATPLSATFDFNKPGVDIADMRSALDRLVDDVNGTDSRIETVGTSANTSTRLDRSGMTMSDGDYSMAETEPITEEGSELLAELNESVRDRRPPPPQRAFTAPSLPSTILPSFAPQSRSASSSSIPPAPPPKDAGSGKSARQEREEMIKEKRREARARDSGEYFVPPRRDVAGNLLEESPATRRKSIGRPSARRSLSTGDAEDMISSGFAAQRRVSVLKNQRGGVLGLTIEDEENPLTDSIERELMKMDNSKKKSYELREREGIVYASSSAEESISHMNQVGDLDGGKAWRTVRRPSDMNEYSRQIKEYRSQEKPGKSHGKVFVKVLRIKGVNLPLPAQQTLFSCTLNNGIHFVTTPETRLTRDAKIEQEFELIEHTKLEFTLTLKVRRDPHIIQQFRVLAPPPPPPQPAPPPAHRGGMRSFFGGGSPKKSKHVRANTEPIIPAAMEENLARYLKPDGTLARAFIAFKDIAPRCDTRLFETSYPLIGHRLEAPGEGGGAGGTMVPKQIGEIVLQIFRLPPLPGVPQNELPQSLDECHRGLRHLNWHKVTYHEGTLTQLGGDCSTWRRRQLRVIGGNLVAFNDVTKRATATIDLKKATGIEDDQEKTQSPGARAHRDVDDFDAMYGVERSFRLIFPHKQEITFFADTDEEKARWLEVFHALVGHIPPNPLWAELIWQRQNELSKSDSSSTQDSDRTRKQR